jgi:hypothetical protein
VIYYGGSKPPSFWNLCCIYWSISLMEIKLK